MTSVAGKDVTKGAPVFAGQSVNNLKKEYTIFFNKFQ